jgi:hypothetical protein
MTKPVDLTNITLDGAPVKEFIAEQERTEIERERVDEIRDKTAGIGYQPAAGKYQNISGSRSERRDYARSIQISEEAAIAINFWEKHRGARHMTEFSSVVSPNEGFIEHGLKETRERLSVLRRMMQETQLEIARYEAVEMKMSEAHGLLTGKIKANGNGEAHATKTITPKGQRAQQLKGILMAGPLTRKDVTDRFESTYGMKRNAVSNLISVSLQAEVIMREGDLLHWIGK